MFNRMLLNWIPGLRDPPQDDPIEVGPDSRTGRPIHYQPSVPTKFFFIKYDLPQSLYLRRGVDNVDQRLELLREIESRSTRLLESVWLSHKELNMIVNEKNRFLLKPVKFSDDYQTYVDVFWLDPIIKIIFRSERFPSTQSIIESIMKENKMPNGLRPNHFSVKGVKSLKGTRFIEARITMKSLMRTTIDDGFICIFGQRLRFYDCIFRVDKRCVTCHSLEHHFVDCPMVEPICFWCGYRRHDGECSEPKICIFCPALNRQNADHLGNDPIACKMNQKAIVTATSFVGHKYLNLYLNPKNFLPRESARRPSFSHSSANGPIPNWPINLDPNCMSYQSAIDNHEVPTPNKRKRT